MRAAALPSLFTGEVVPGVYRFTGRMAPSVLAEQAARHGWRAFHLNGHTVQDKQSFLRAGAEAMNFPAYFGYNWDAFEESLTDLSWAPARGYLLLYDDVANFARHAPQEWATALTILQSAVAAWQRRATPLIVLLRRSGSGSSGQLPAL